MIDLSLLRQAVAMGGGQLWAMRREGAMQLATAQDRRNTECAVRQGERLADGSYSRVRGGVAIIPVRGPLVNRFQWGYFSYEEIERDIRMALGDERVNSIMLDIESPGGMAAGCDECAAFIRKAAGEKPISAHIESMGASAAYWLASAAEHITAAPSAMVGSVGVIIRYTDFSTMFERWGATKVEIMATQSPNKSHPSGSEEERAELQPIVDELADMFIDSVAAFRGVARKDVLNHFGQGAIMTASAGLSRRMIDAVSHFDDSLAALAERRVSATGPDAAAGRARGPAINRREDKEIDMSKVDPAAGQDKDRPAAAPAAETQDGKAPLRLSMEPVADPAAGDDALRAEFAEIAGIAAQAARLGVAIDAAKAVKDGVKPAVLRQQVLTSLAESDAARNIVAAAPHPAAAASGKTALVSRAKALGEQQTERRKRAS